MTTFAKAYTLLREEGQRKRADILRKASNFATLASYYRYRDAVDFEVLVTARHPLVMETFPSLGVATSMILLPSRQTKPVGCTIQHAQKRNGEHTNCPPIQDLTKKGRLMNKTVSLPTQNTRSLSRKIGSSTPNQRSHAPQTRYQFYVEQLPLVSQQAEVLR